MIVFEDAQLIIAATPKTGTLSLEAALEPYATHIFNATVEEQHVSCNDIRKEYPNHQIITCMRDPLSWIESKFCYLAMPIFRGGMYDASGRRYENFIKSIIKGLRPWPEPYMHQSAYVGGADIIFPYEEYDKMLEFISQRINQQLDVPILNKSPKRKMILSDETKSDLNNFLAVEYILYEKVCSGFL